MYFFWICADILFRSIKIKLPYKLETFFSK